MKHSQFDERNPGAPAWCPFVAHDVGAGSEPLFPSNLIRLRDERGLLRHIVTTARSHVNMTFLSELVSGKSSEVRRCHCVIPLPLSLSRDISATVVAYRPPSVASPPEPPRDVSPTHSATAPLLIHGQASK